MSTRISKVFGSKNPNIPHLVAKGKHGISGEVGDLRSDVDEAFASLEASGMGSVYIDEWPNLVAPAVNAIKTSFASSASDVVLAAADFNGAVGAANMDPPRVPNITTSSNANIDAVAVVLTGVVEDENGKEIAQTDTLTLTDGGGVTQSFVKAFKRFTGGHIPAQSGTGGSIQLGITKIVGLTKPIRSLQGAPITFKEVAAGAVATNGTVVSAASSAPNGTYSPNGTPGGTDDYALIYLVDATL